MNKTLYLSILAVIITSPVMASSAARTAGRTVPEIIAASRQAASQRAQQATQAVRTAQPRVANPQTPRRSLYDIMGKPNPNQPSAVIPYQAPQTALMTLPKSSQQMSQAMPKTGMSKMPSQMGTEKINPKDLTTGVYPALLVVLVQLGVLSVEAAWDALEAMWDAKERVADEELIKAREALLLEMARQDF